MLEEENDPEAELQKFSEKTNYLKEWVMGKKKKKNSQYVDRETIPEDVDQNTPRKSTQSKEMRQYSEKYNIKKYERRLQYLNRIEYPVDPQNFAQVQSRFLLPKLQSIEKKQLKDTLNIKPFKERKTSILNMIQNEFLKRKLQIIKKRSTKQPEKRNFESLNFISQKAKSVPRVLKLKRNLKLESLHNLKSKLVQNEQDNMQIQNLLSRNNRRYSVPELMKKINQYRYQ